MFSTIKKSVLSLALISGGAFAVQNGQQLPQQQQQAYHFVVFQTVNYLHHHNIPVNSQNVANHSGMVMNAMNANPALMQQQFQQYQHMMNAANQHGIGQGRGRASSGSM